MSWAQCIALLVEFQARPSVIPPLWRDDRCAPKSVEQVDLEGNHSYKFIYSGFSRTSSNGRKLLILLVGAGRFERPTPCAQGRCATRLRYAPTYGKARLSRITRGLSVSLDRLPDGLQRPFS